MTKQLSKTIFLGSLVASLQTTSMPGKQCKIKHTFGFTVVGQSEAYRPYTVCSTFGLWKMSQDVVSVKVTATGATTGSLLNQDTYPTTQETRVVTTQGLKMQLPMLPCSNHSSRASYCSRKVHKSDKRPTPQMSQLLLNLTQNETWRSTFTCKHRELLLSLSQSNPRQSLKEVWQVSKWVLILLLGPCVQARPIR